MLIADHSIRSKAKPLAFLIKYQKRNVSDSVTLTAIDRSPGIPMSQTKHHKTARLRVPLLKSQSHLGHATSRVNRMYNEDRYSANVIKLPHDKIVFNFSIFDGHGGERCSSFLSSNLSRVVEESNELIADDIKAREELIKSYWKNVGGYWKRWYKHRKDNFDTMKASIDAISLSKFSNFKDDLPLRVPLSFLKADYEFFNQVENDSGSTCTSVFIETIHADDKSFTPVYENYYFNRKTISKLTVAHVGDTRAILVDRNGECHSLTSSHHPSNEVEAARLRKYAANFFMTDSFGEERFISLANTRSFGDIDYKQIGVTAEPDISQFIVGDAATISRHLTKEEIQNYTIGGLGGDESFLILCSDGVTDELTNQEIADIVMSHFNMKGHLVGTPQRGAEEVIKFVEYVGGDDNATCLVIRLNGWGRWPVVDRTGELRSARLDDYNPRSNRA